MPYTTPPNFVDDAILSASQLNILSADIEFLAGLITGVNVPFKAVGGTGDFDQAYRIRHLGRYLHYKVVMSSGTHDNLEIEYNEVTIFADGGSQSAPYEWSGYIDLHDTGVITPTPTVGEFYQVILYFVYGTPGDALVHYLLESNEVAL